MNKKNNPYRNSKYLLSAYNFQQFPTDSGREVAFVGRSNVGKSSVINSITDHKRLAKTSKTPGRTQQINFFTVENYIRLVDLPGYGYARVHKSIKKQWEVLINDYFSARNSLVGLILILDIRRDVTLQDKEMLGWCQAVKIPVHLLINKADKFSYQQKSKSFEKFKKFFPAEELSIQLFSTIDRTGVDEVTHILNRWLYGE